MKALVIEHDLLKQIISYYWDGLNIGSFCITHTKGKNMVNLQRVAQVRAGSTNVDFEPRVQTSTFTMVQFTISRAFSTLA